METELVQKTKTKTKNKLEVPNSQQPLSSKRESENTGRPL